MGRVLIFLFLGVIINHGLAIRITRFVVPAVASFGSLVDLDCAYDLENDHLYDVKWYKDGDEFFRCKSDGQVQGFEVEGIDLYKSRQASLGSCPVTITVVNSKSAGRYLCEISSEAPEFKTTGRWVYMRIEAAAPSKRVQVEETSTYLMAATQASTQINGSSNASKKSLFLLTYSFGVFLITIRRYLRSI